MTDQIALRRLVGDNVRSLRKTRGWSQEELGERAALSYKFVGEIERGAVNPSLDSLLSIANALTVEVAKLFLTERLAVLTDTEVADIQSALAILSNVFVAPENKVNSQAEVGRKSR
ncbi:MAG: helix-turn-helix transcriptional regulator [Desulfobulbaceae bacterium]|nr:helix-turn-helix transcriptional regulator [Desulfobulbaceae bacterium]